jgi:hypothetical protein
MFAQFYNGTNTLARVPLDAANNSSIAACDSGPMRNGGFASVLRN